MPYYCLTYIFLFPWIYRFRHTLFLVYSGLIFSYSTFLQLLSMVFKHRVTSNQVIRLRENQSPAYIRKDVSTTANPTSSTHLDEISEGNQDARLGKIDKNMNEKYTYAKLSVILEIHFSTMLYSNFLQFELQYSRQAHW